MFGLLYRQLLYRLKYRQKKKDRKFSQIISWENQDYNQFTCTLILYSVLRYMYSYMLHLCIIYKYISLAHKIHFINMLIFHPCYFLEPVYIHVHGNLSD